MFIERHVLLLQQVRRLLNDLFQTRLGFGSLERHEAEKIDELRALASKLRHFRPQTPQQTHQVALLWLRRARSTREDDVMETGNQYELGRVWRLTCRCEG